MNSYTSIVVQAIYRLKSPLCVFPSCSEPSKASHKVSCFHRMTYSKPENSFSTQWGFYRIIFNYPRVLARVTTWLSPNYICSREKLAQALSTFQLSAASRERFTADSTAITNYEQQVRVQSISYKRIALALKTCTYAEQTVN